MQFCLFLHFHRDSEHFGQQHLEARPPRLHESRRAEVHQEVAIRREQQRLHRDARSSHLLPRASQRTDSADE